MEEAGQTPRRDEDPVNSPGKLEIAYFLKVNEPKKNFSIQMLIHR